MTENAVRFLAKNELGHFSTARFWPGPSLDWRSPHWHLMGFLCYSSLVQGDKYVSEWWMWHLNQYSAGYLTYGYIKFAKKLKFMIALIWKL